MAHFYGSVQGMRGRASRLGGKGSGMDTVCASHEGAIRVRAYWNEERKEDWVMISFITWQGAGENRTIYAGPIGKFDPLRLTGLKHAIMAD
jgi:hypothetical protein